MKSKIRIIDNKKISLTDEEFSYYEKLCQHYTKPNQKGEEYFKDLFETNKDGVIVFLKPPTVKAVSMEILLFISNIMQHQHLRAMREEFDILKNETLLQLKELEKANNLIASLVEQKDAKLLDKS